MNQTTPNPSSALDAVGPAQPAPSPPPRIPDYELIRRIGGGAYGDVWLARSATGVFRALKIVCRRTFDDDRPYEREFEGIQHFERISRGHPGQLALFHVGRGEGYFYYVMELADAVGVQRPKSEVQGHTNTRPATLDGGLETLDSLAYAPHTLRADLGHGRLPAAQVLEVGLTLTEALAHLHAHGLVHRDVKPSNIIFVNGQPKLADIGLVTDASDQCSIVGTEGYLPPEGPGAPAADIFALGKVLYEATTGLDRRQLPQLPSDLRDWLDAKLVFELNEIILKACAADPRQRYAGTAEMLADLLLVSAGRSVRHTHALERRLALARRTAITSFAIMLLGIVPYSLAIRSAWLAEQRKRQAEASAKEAIAQKEVAEAVRRFLQQDLLRQANPVEQANALRELGGGFEAKENPTIKELLDRAAVELTPGRIETKFSGSREVQASLLSVVGETYLDIGEYGKSVEFLSRASALYQEIRGADHPDSLDTLERLAYGYEHVGKLPQAIDLLEQVRDRRIRKSGVEDPETLITRSRLALAYREAGKLSQAIALFEQVQDAQVKQLGADHPSTLSTLASLAGAYNDAGDTTRALQMFEQVRHMRTSTLGAEHPNTVVALNDLGLAYMDAGNLPKAIELFEQARDAFVKTIGADHPNTLTTLGNLAMTFEAAGRLPQAIELLEQVRDAQTKKLGANHPNTLTTLHNLGAAYKAAGKLSQAIALLEQVRAARTKRLGADHPATLATLQKLAAAYQGAGKVPQAIDLLESVRDTLLKQFGAEHPDTLVAQNNLALGYSYAGRLPEAIALFEHARQGFLKRLGADHPSTLKNLGGLAGTYQAAGKLPQAIELFERVRDVQVRNLGADHPDTLATLHNLAAAYQGANELPQAIKLFEQVHEAEINKLGAEHPLTLATENHLAGAYRAAGKLPQAIEQFERTRKTSIKTLGDNHPSTLGILHNLADAYQASGKWDQALLRYRQAAEGFEKRKFKDRESETVVLALIACLEHLEQDAEAQAWQTKRLGLVKQREGAESPAYASTLARVGLPLLQRQQWTDAEATLRECLTIRETTQPEEWLTFNTRSMLGAALLGQKRYAEAEPLLLAGYEGLLLRLGKIPPQARVRLHEALDRLVKLYDAWDKQAEAARWRREAKDYPVLP